MRHLFQARNILLTFMFAIFPIISIMAWLAGKGEMNYDPVLIAFTGFIIIYRIFTTRHGLTSKNFKFLSILALLILYKYLFPYLTETKFSLTASIMDGKWVVYLILAILWTNTFGLPEIKTMHRLCVFFCIIYIAKALVLLANEGIGRSGVLLEANYDGFMILMIYCFNDQIQDKKRWHTIAILLATFLTLSRTGFISLFVIWGLKAIKKNFFLLIPLVFIVALIVYIGVYLRGVDSVEHLDRFVYWEQAIVAFQGFDITNVLFGCPPGIPLQMHIIPEFYWTIDLFEEMKALRGIFPFMFHSTYLRIAFTWGLPAAILFVIFIIYKFFVSQYPPLKRLCAISLVQGISLSLLTLPNVSLLLFITYIMGITYNRYYNTTNNYV